MSDISAMAVTPETLLQSAAAHVSAARDTQGGDSRHHAALAQVYMRCSSLLIDDPSAALDVNKAVSLLREAQVHGEHVYGDPKPDYVSLADLRVTMARVASRHRRGE